MKGIIITLVVVSFFSCTKEQIEQAQTNIIVQMMTDGQWKVSKMSSPTTDASTQFNGYSFQFKTNNTVDAVKTGTLVSVGTWSASLTAQTITSAFTGSGSNATLVLLNGTWKIDKSASNYVEASQTVNGVRWDLRLDKL